MWDAAGGASYTPSLAVGETPLCPRGAGAGSVRGPHSDTQWPTVTCVPWPCSPCPPWHLCLADPWAQVLHSGWDHLFLVIMKKCSTCKLMYILLKLYLMTTTVSIVPSFFPLHGKYFCCVQGIWVLMSSSYLSAELGLALLFYLAAVKSKLILLL